MQFLLTFNIEKRDIVIKCEAEFRIGLTHTCKNNFVSLATRKQCTMQFPTTSYIKTRTVFRHHFAKRNIAIGFYGITNQRLNFFERFLDLTKVMNKRGFTVDIKRSSIALSKLSNGNIFAIKGTTSISKMIHVISTPVKKALE